MNTATDILTYAKTHDISLIAEDGLLKIDAPKKELTDDFLESAKQHKSEILVALTKEYRWNHELVDQGYVWCMDCQYWNNLACKHIDNPYRKQCAHAPRICKWYEATE